MALTTHQLQSCHYFPFPSVPSSWCRGSKLKRSVPSSFPVVQKDGFISLKCRSCLSVGASVALGPKSKLFKISAFKGSSRHDGSGSRSSGSKSLKNPAKVSYWQHESKESLAESSKVQNVVPASYTAADETTTRSQAIQNLFKNWLILLRLPSQTQPVEEVNEPSSTSTADETTTPGSQAIQNLFKNWLILLRLPSQTQPVEEVNKPSSTSTELSKTKQKQERGEVSKAAWCYFMGLDATIKIPLLIFTPLCLAVNLIYGSEVSKELTPLWFLGPIIFVFYIKMFRAICGLYMFSFKRTLKVIKDLPAFSLLAYDYIFCGKLIQAIRTRIWKPMVDIKNLNYSEQSRRILKDFQGWLVERYLDFIESVWPYYCRTIRFLKRANLI